MSSFEQRITEFIITKRETEIKEFLYFFGKKYKFLR